MKNKKVIFTALFGIYDKLPQYSSIDKEFDYICFSNNYPDKTKIGQWEIRNINNNIKNNIYLSRLPKLLPHKYLSEYDYSLYLDSNLEITSSLIYNEIKDKIKQNTLWAGVEHLKRNCIYDELYICVSNGKSNFKEALKVEKFLLNKKFPSKYGLFENNIILRKHNDLLIKKIDEKWWKLYNELSKRDQMTLFYVFWKFSFIPDHLFSINENSRNKIGISYFNHIPRDKRDSLFGIFKIRINQILYRLLKSKKK